jgi:hypothetical protein
MKMKMELEYRTNGNGASGPTRCIGGASLAQRLRGMTPQQRAVLAADIIEGRVILLELTAKSVATLCGANLAYVALALACTAEERDRVRRGHGRLPARVQRPAAVVDWAVVGDQMLADAIKSMGMDRALEIAVAVERGVAA